MRILTKIINNKYHNVSLDGFVISMFLSVSDIYIFGCELIVARKYCKQEKNTYLLFGKF